MLVFSNIQWHTYVDDIAWIVAISSALSSAMPPYEVFNFAPRFQKVYRVIGILVGTVGALNFRGITMKLYPSYNVAQQNGGKDATQLPPKS